MLREKGFFKTAIMNQEELREILCYENILHFAESNPSTNTRVIAQRLCISKFTQIFPESMEEPHIFLGCFVTLSVITGWLGVPISTMKGNYQRKLVDSARPLSSEGRSLQEPKETMKIPERFIELDLNIMELKYRE
ncbi:hypothetical protein TNCV_1388401 [Trichonephila clavipes]|nr:hypothetical protein TNCV_1388401 [Trichonephila clavipes]